MVPKKHEVPAAEFIGQPDEARQGTRRLHHGKAAVAPESILALDDDREIQALVEYFRKGPRRIQCQRTQHRLDLAAEIIRDPSGLSVGPGFRLDEHHAARREFRHEHIVQQLVLLIHQAHGVTRESPAIAPTPTIHRVLP